MAVIYLPQDPRAAMWGQSLGTALGGAFEEIQKKKDSKILQEILDNPNLSDEQKYSQVQTRLGSSGLSLLKEQLQAKEPLLKMKQTQAETSKAEAETERAKVGAAKEQQETDFAKTEQPLKLAKDKAEIAKNTAEAQKAFIDMQTAPDMARKAKAEADLATAKAKLEANKAQLVDTLAKGSDAANPLSSLGMTQDVWDSLPKLKQQSVRANLKSGEPDKALAELTKPDPASAKVVAIDDPTMKVINTASTIANSAKDVVAAAESGKSGGGPGGSIRAWLIEKGLITPDASFAQQLAAQHQMLLNNVQGGGGFGGEWKVRLGTKTIPNVQQGPAFQIIESNMILKDRMTELQREKARYEGTKVNTKPIDDAIAQIKPIIDETETLKGDDYGNLYYKGNMVDAKTMKPIQANAVEPTQQFKVGQKMFTGADVNEAARKLGADPQEILKKMEQAQ